MAVSSSSCCSWFVINTNDWIAITGPTQGSGSNAITYTVVPNPTSIPNIGNLLIGGQLYTVLQAATQPPAVWITTPTNETALLGGTANFQAAATGAEPLAYQWFFNQTNPVPGATTPALTVTNAQLANDGGYSVVVTNSAGAATSATATLTVVVPPAIATQPANETVIAGTTASFRVGADGTGPLSYQWFFNQTNLLAGATTAALTLPNAQPANVGGYSVVVANLAGPVTSGVATLNVLLPPDIAQQPASLTTNQGATVAFNVAATGTAPLSYQWSFNGNAIPNATTSSLTLTGVQPANAGAYLVVVTNVAGAATGAPAVLAVNVAPVITGQPVNVTTNQGAAVAFTLPPPARPRFRINGVSTGSPFPTPPPPC